MQIHIAIGSHSTHSSGDCTRSTVQAEHALLLTDAKNRMFSHYYVYCHYQTYAFATATASAIATAAATAVSTATITTVPLLTHSGDDPTD